MSDVFVLGAGMVGVSTALALQARGHHVALIDRKDPGRETSYGNGGIIQIESVEPVPFPRNLSALIKIALRQSRDVRFHWAALPSHLGPLWSYYRHSTARRYKEAARIYSRLAIRSIADHRPLIEASNAGNIINATGLRRLYRSQSALEKAAAIAGYLSSEYGVASNMKQSFEGQCCALNESRFYEEANFMGSAFVYLTCSSAKLDSIDLTPVNRVSFSFRKAS